MTGARNREFYRTRVVDAFVLTVSPAQTQILCRAAGMSLAELAEAAGLERASVAAITNGKRPDVRASVVVRMANVLAARLKHYTPSSALDLLTDGTKRTETARQAEARERLLMLQAVTEKLEQRMRR